MSQVNQTVGNMAQSVPAASPHSNTQSLCMPSIHLPSFRRDSGVKDDIPQFLERFSQQTSHLPAETRLSLLEQQCVGDWCKGLRHNFSVVVIVVISAPKVKEHSGKGVQTLWTISYDLSE